MRHQGSLCGLMGSTQGAFAFNPEPSNLELHMLEALNPN